MPDKPDEKRLAWIAGAIERLEAERDGREYECDAPAGKWCEPSCGTLYEGTMYRAKPTPKYRPFTAVELLERLPLRFRHHGETQTLVAYACNQTRVIIQSEDGGHLWEWMICDLMPGTVRDDGTPCGVLLEGG